MARAGPAARMGGRGAEAECAGGSGASPEPEAVLGGVGWGTYTAAGFKVVEIESGRLEDRPVGKHSSITNQSCGLHLSFTVCIFSGVDRSWVDNASEEITILMIYMYLLCQMAGIARGSQISTSLDPLL